MAKMRGPEGRHALMPEAPMFHVGGPCISHALGMFTIIWGIL